MEILTSHVWGEIARHPLAHATAPTPSMSGTVVYVVCACGQRRRVEAAAWAAEIDRRAAGAAAKGAFAARTAALIAGVE